jgi:hypothetical protein
MEKDKNRHYETLKDEMFPHLLPHPKTSGETKEKRKQVLKKIWGWINEGCHKYEKIKI